MTNGLYRIFLRGNSTTVAPLRLCALLFLVLSYSNTAHAAIGLISKDSSELETQRQLYLSAKDALQKRHFKTYRKLNQKLAGYPLKPYLDYYELERRLSRLPHDDVDAFLEHNPNSYLANRLTKKWLHTLAQKKRWHDYRTYYTVKTPQTELTCYALEARIRTGDKTALGEVSNIWNVSHSQPDECDPLFTLWMNSTEFNQGLVWERFGKALKAGKLQLARFIAKQFDHSNQAIAALYIEVHRHPSTLNKTSRFQEQTPKMQEIILHGIQRFARRDALNALNAWSKYDAQQLFEDEHRFETQQYLASRLVRQGHQESAETLIKHIPRLSSEQLTERLIREYLKEKDWAKALSYIQKLPNDNQQSERWLYWRARAMEQLGVSSSTFPPPKEIYKNLAIERSYYGFLAADLLGNQYTLGDNPTLHNQKAVVDIANRPATIRARELLATGEVLNARREWFFMSSRLNTSEHIAAAKLANQWGWHNNTIISLATAKSWDDLQLRFPLAYNKQVLSTAQRLEVSPLLLFAIARQESAFAADARSPAGALGLMQLMPSTAKMTARKAGIKFKTYDLLQPSKNIELGSHYLTSLLKQFNGNRILAAAAYNAGPNRVKQWLKATAEQLPYDVWIETIPYKETRHYVQNVLAYSVIYGYRMGTIPSLLSTHETNQAL